MAGRLAGWLDGWLAAEGSELMAEDSVLRWEGSELRTQS